MTMDREAYRDVLKYEIQKIDNKIIKLEKMLEQHSGTFGTQDEINNLKNLREQKKFELTLFE